MKRLARIAHTGSLVAIVTFDELDNAIPENGKRLMPVYFMGELDYVYCITQHEFESNVGFKFNDLEEWSFNPPPKDIKKEAEFGLYSIYKKIGIDIPSNHEQILEFVTSDISETADTCFTSEDINIAFRRLIETLQTD